MGSLKQEAAAHCSRCPSGTPTCSARATKDSSTFVQFRFHVRLIHFSASRSLRFASILSREIQTKVQARVHVQVQLQDEVQVQVQVQNKAKQVQVSVQDAAGVLFRTFEFQILVGCVVAKER